MPEEKFQRFLKEMDTDNSGNISFVEFAVAIRSFMKRKYEAGASGESGSSDLHSLSVQGPPGEKGIYLLKYLEKLEKIR
jgi:hypothetical protein